MQQKMLETIRCGHYPALCSTIPRKSKVDLQIFSFLLILYRHKLDMIKLIKILKKTNI